MFFFMLNKESKQTEINSTKCMYVICAAHKSPSGTQKIKHQRTSNIQKLILFAPCYFTTSISFMYAPKCDIVSGTLE